MTRARNTLGRMVMFAAAASAAALVAGCGSEGNPAGPQGGAKPPLLLACSSNRPPSAPSSRDIYFYDCRFGQPAVIPPNLGSPYDESTLGLSGDGRWLAFNTTNPLVGTISELVLYHVSDGTFSTLVTPGRFFGPLNPSLSYDGRYLAFQDQVGSAFELDVTLMDALADTLIPTPRLHLIGALDFDPSLSGDGGLIAFSTSRSGSYDVALYDVRGDSLVPLPGCNSPLSDLGVTISRDGRFLAFHSNRPGGEGLFDVCVYDRATASLLAVPGANTALSDLNPAISPDGLWVAFTTEAEGGSDIRLYDLAARRLVPVPGLNDPYFAERFPSLADLR
jgi:Tol biopolymer transport system component